MHAARRIRVDADRRSGSELPRRDRLRRRGLVNVSPGGLSDDRVPARGPFAPEATPCAPGQNLTSRNHR